MMDKVDAIILPLSVASSPVLRTNLGVGGIKHNHTGIRQETQVVFRFRETFLERLGREFGKNVPGSLYRTRQNRGKKKML